MLSGLRWPGQSHGFLAPCKRKITRNEEVLHLFRCYTHTPKAGVTLGDLQMLQKRLVVFRFTVPVENPDIGIPAKGNRRCLRFQTPDLQLQIQGEDLTYV